MADDSGTEPDQETQQDATAPAPEEAAEHASDEVSEASESEPGKDAGGGDEGAGDGAGEVGAKAEDLEEIEAERKERLDPDNRPDAAEVDNTGRTFDAEAGRFTDSDDYDESDKPFPPAEEQDG